MIMYSTLTANHLCRVLRRPSCCFRSSRLFLSSASTAANGDFLSSLAQSLPHVDISTNPYDCEAHGRGESYHTTQQPPAAVVTPTSRDDVVEIVKQCAKHRIPLIPYGAGTSVEGHICAMQSGTISLDMTRLDSMEFFESEEGLPEAHAVVGAGVHRKQLNDALRHTGMHFVVDPGADATIGGMVACGASGTTAVKYGTMRENILGLECVLPNGTVVNCGTRALKSSAGYDLTSLMTGSEGTLGVITKIIVKLHPLPGHVTSALCVFEDLFHAAQAVAAHKLCGIPLSRCELLDHVSVDAFNQYVSSRNDNVGKPMEVKPTLFLELEGASETEVKEQVSMTETICVQDYGGSNFDFTLGEAERRKLWSARHDLYYASLALRPGASDALLTDACVPLSKFADLIVATARDVEELNVVGPCFGHAGDGNFHCILPLVEGDTDDYLSRVHQVNDNLIQRTLAAGGTCTGEHGIGYGKMKYLELQYGSATVNAMKLVKQAFDPLNIMNPGKVVSP